MLPFFGSGGKALAISRKKGMMAIVYILLSFPSKLVGILSYLKISQLFSFSKFKIRTFFVELNVNVTTSNIIISIIKKFNYKLAHCISQ